MSAVRRDELAAKVRETNEDNAADDRAKAQREITGEPPKSEAARIEQAARDAKRQVAKDTHEVAERDRAASAADQDRDHKEPLDARIHRLEARLAKRRHVLSVRTSDVSGKARSKLGSPLLIAGAAGAGFVAALFFRRSKSKDDRPRREKPEVVMRPSVFATVTDALTLATTLLAMMPLIRSKAKEGVQEATGEVPPE